MRILSKPALHEHCQKQRTMSSIASMTEEDSAVGVQKEVFVTEDVKSEHNQNEANSYPGSIHLLGSIQF